MLRLLPLGREGVRVDRKSEEQVKGGGRRESIEAGVRFGGEFSVRTEFGSCCTMSS
jgi:hypothetical protein